MRLAPALAIVLLAAPALAQNRDPYTHLERPLADRFCDGMGREVAAGFAGTADCVSWIYAIEVEFDRAWKSAVGQSLAYAAALGRRPGIILVCTRSDALCRNASLGIRQTIGAIGARLTLWECLPTDPSLSACLRRECGPTGCA